MPADSQAIARLTEDRVTASNRLQVVRDSKLAAQQALDRWTASEATIVDEIADIDAAIAETIAGP